MILAFLELARGAQHDLHIRISELSDKKQAAVVGQRRDTDSAVMLDHLTGAGSAVGQLGFVAADVDYAPVVYIILFDRLFRKLHTVYLRKFYIGITLNTIY